MNYEQIELIVAILAALLTGLAGIIVYCVIILIIRLAGREIPGRSFPGLFA
jgi:hypothetical protein